MVLDELAWSNKVTLLWVLGHLGVQSNEKVDKLAREGSSRDFLETEPVVGVAQCVSMATITAWLRIAYEEIWSDQLRYRQAKFLLLTSTRPAVARELLGLCSEDIKLIAGYCWLRYHLKNIELVEYPMCYHCGCAKETAKHVLCWCQPLVTIRQKLLDRLSMNLEDRGRANALVPSIRGLVILLLLLYNKCNDHV